MEDEAAHRRIERLFYKKLMAKYPDHPWLNTARARAAMEETMPVPHDPKAKFIDQPWHTVTTLREAAHQLDAALTEASAKLGACDYLERIEHTPNAWRIYGTIDSLIAKGYDADHIVKWLTEGEAREP